MKAHTDWLKARMETMPGAVIGGRSQVFVTKAQYPGSDSAVKVTYPYWVIHPQDGNDEQTRFTGPKLTQHPRFTIHSVGLSYDSAAIAGENVKKILIVNGFGVVPAIGGENSRRVWYDVPIPVQTDADVTPAIAFHVAECGFESDLTP